MNDFDQQQLLQGPPPQSLLPAPDGDTPKSRPGEPAGRGGSRRWLPGLGALLLFTGALALGVWQHYAQHRQVADVAEQQANFVPSVRVEAVTQRLGKCT